MPKERIVVLMGGPSSEYEVSLAAGKKIIQALDPDAYTAEPVIVSRNRAWISVSRESFLKASAADFPDAAEAIAKKNEHTALMDLSRNPPGAVFIAMHGEFGEDGTVQGLLESAGVAYTGSGIIASALGMDKIRSAALFREAGLTVPEFAVITRASLPGLIRANSGIVEQIESLGVPLVVKPATGGSSVGVSIVRHADQVKDAVEEALRHSRQTILQKYISGKELTCGVLETPESTIQLQPTEIIPKEREFFDYHSKYTFGASHEITPPNLPEEAIRRIQETALKTHHALGCAGMSRTDMILGGDGTLYVLEINTIPGMAETSLLPQAAAAAGIPFPKLLEYIIIAAKRKARI